MVTQYPHLMTITPKNDGSVDENGDYVGGTTGVTFNTVCRAESSSGNGYIASADGQRLDYSWIVYLPKNVQKIPLGATVQVSEGEEEILTDTVKRFFRGQLNARAWL